jgi:hypothetical protein
VNRRNTLDEWGLAIAVFVIVAIVWSFILAGKRACEDEGGRFVRGVLWFECIGGRP